MKFVGKDGKLRIYTRAYGYLEVHFSNMDFSAAIGRAKAEEILVLDNGLVNKYAHYISGNDQVIFDPIGISFSCVVDDITHVNTTNGFKEIVYQALICRDARNDETDGTWTAYGTSTKGNYENKPGTRNPDFISPLGTAIDSGTVTSVSWDTIVTTITDTSKSWVNGEVTDCMMKVTSGDLAGKYYKVVDNDATRMFVVEDLVSDASNRLNIGDTYELYDNHRTVDMGFKLTGPSNNICYTFQEVYWPPSEISLSEAEDGITMSATGGIYGPVVRTADWLTPLTIY